MGAVYDNKTINANSIKTGESGTVLYNGSISITPAGVDIVLSKSILNFYILVIINNSTSSSRFVSTVIPTGCLLDGYIFYTGASNISTATNVLILAFSTNNNQQLNIKSFTGQISDTFTIVGY